MKNSSLTFIGIIFLLLFTTSNIRANNEITKAKESKAVTEAKTEIKSMADRVMEIKETDFKTLSKEEKKELRKELKSIKKDFKTYSKSENPAVAEAAAEAARGSGFYISGGALLIIIILLILL